MNAVPKLNVVRDRKYLDSQHDDACLISGEYGNENESVVPAHLGSFRGMKRGDDESLPIKQRFHAEGHQKGEWSMWRKWMPDWLIREALRAYARERYRNWLASLGPMKAPHRETNNG